MNNPSAPLLALTSLLLLLTSGCYFPPGYQPAYAPEPQPAYGPVANVPTALVVVVEDEITQEEYLARRNEIINYLIDRGYITNGNDLVNDPADAVRIIRAIISGGGFSLSVFNQDSAAGPGPDLETTDILYPADPYFIFGFSYLYEIGPRRLGPRPPGYRPHPRPPHEGPPPGRRVFDHDRHWSRPGQPDRNDHKAAPPPDRRPRDGKNPRPDRQPPPPNRKPDDHGPARPDTHATPPPSVNQPQNQDHRRTDPTTVRPSPTPGKTPDKNGPGRPADRPKLPPDVVSPRGPGHPPPDKTGPVPPPAGPTSSVGRLPVPAPRTPPSAAPASKPAPRPTPAPAPAPAPAPEKSDSADTTTPVLNDRGQRKQQN